MTEEADKRGRPAGRMTYRAVTSLAWTVWALCVVLLVLTALLDHYTPPLPNKGNGSMYAFFGVPLLVYATVGAFVASRRPGNPVGWLLCVIGLILALVGFGVLYPDYVLVGHPGSSLPGAVYMACISQSLVVLPLLIATFTLLILLFQDGRLPDRSLRVVPWIIVVGGATSALWALTADSAFPRYSMPNPLHVEGAIGDAVDGFGRLGASAILVSFVIAIIVVFVRLGSARGAERQQLKWFAYAAAVLLGTTFLAPLVWFLPGWLSFPLGIVVFSAIPVAVGIAVLKYRLYDIDRIINRTLVYGLLTALLTAGYFGTIIALQGVGSLLYQVPFRAIIGQQSTLAVVASTLTMATLFNPLRRRIQSLVDRRFYRKKYDARKTLEAFSLKLRDETDLEALNEELVGAVRETMQPAHVSLWLRPDTATQRHEPG